MKMKKDFSNITIYTKSGNKISFCGKYRRDLEKHNWHYYETDKGGIYHFRKDAMEVVLDE